MPAAGAQGTGAGVAGVDRDENREAVGAVIAGLAADAFGLHISILLVAAVTFAFGVVVVVVVRMHETLRRRPDASSP